MSDSREPVEFDGETFHPVPDDVAYASESGRIAFWDHRIGREFRLVYSRLRDGTLCVCYHVGGKRRDRVAARLIWRAFRGAVPATHWVGTVSSDPADVRLDNLCLRTRREVNGGLVSGRAKLCRRDVMDIRSRPEASVGDLVRRYGVSRTTIISVRSGQRYRDVDTPYDPPATQEQRDRLRHRMQQVDIESNFIEFVVGRVHRSGRVSLPIRLAEKSGVSHWVRINRIRLLRRHGLLREIGKQMYAAAVDMPEHEWQSHLADTQLSPHQSGVLSLRLRQSISELPEVPPEIAERIIEATSVEGEFPGAVISRYTLSGGQRRETIQHLVGSGVIEKKTNRTLVFCDMPHRAPVFARTCRRPDPVLRGDIDYRAVVRMLARGDDLGAVSYETGVPATVCDKMAKALRMTGVVRQLLGTGKRNQLPRLLDIPCEAADAIASHVDRDSSSDIRSAI